MDQKTIVKYATYVIGVITLASLIKVATLQVIILGICALANIFYVNSK